jgi:hypothetical protein
MKIITSFANLNHGLLSLLLGLFLLGCGNPALDEMGINSQSDTVNSGATSLISVTNNMDKEQTENGLLACFRNRCGNVHCDSKGKNCYVRCCHYAGTACSGSYVIGECWTETDTSYHGYCGPTHNC